jgi:hypothetical protein
VVNLQRLAWYVKRTGSLAKPGGPRRQRLSLVGKTVGDVVGSGNQELEIVAIA